MNVKYYLEKVNQIYLKEIDGLHGIPLNIVSDRNSRFTSRFWQSLQKSVGSKLRMSSAYHLQTDGQTERTIQSLEQLLRTCILEH